MAIKNRHISRENRCDVSVFCFLIVSSTSLVLMALRLEPKEIEKLHGVFILSHKLKALFLVKHLSSQVCHLGGQTDSALPRLFCFLYGVIHQAATKVLSPKVLSHGDAELRNGGIPIGEENIACHFSVQGRNPIAALRIWVGAIFQCSAAVIST